MGYTAYMEKGMIDLPESEPDWKDGKPDFTIYAVEVLQQYMQRNKLNSDTERKFSELIAAFKSGAKVLPEPKREPNTITDAEIVSLCRRLMYQPIR